MSRKLFISYRRSDSLEVDLIIDRLRSEFGCDIWIDRLSILGGDEWRKEIRLGIEKADLILLMLTPAAAESEFVKEEVDYAQEISKRIIPLQIKPVTVDQLVTLNVSHLNYIDFVGDALKWEKLIGVFPYSLQRDLRHHANVHLREMHHQYLKSLFSTYGTVRLMPSPSWNSDDFKLLDIYTPLYFGIELQGEFRENQLIDWWVVQTDQKQRWARMDSFFANLPTTVVLPALNDRYRIFPSMEIETEDLRYLEKQIYENIPEEIPEGGHQIWTLESEEVVALQKYAVVVGNPGSGKSSLIRYIALCLAEDMLLEGSENNEPTKGIARLDFWPLPTFTPVIVEFRELIEFLGKDREEITLERFFDYIQAKKLRPHLIADYLNDLRQQMQHGEVMLFLDGLDEIPDSLNRRDHIKTFVNLLRTQFPKCRITITSRPYAYRNEDWKLSGFGLNEIAGAEYKNLESLAYRLLQANFPSEALFQEVHTFINSLSPLPPEISHSPFFFTLAAAIWLNHRTPVTRRFIFSSEGNIYRECINLLVEWWAVKDNTQSQSLLNRIGLDEQQFRTLLESLAFRIHNRSNRDNIFTAGNITDALLDLNFKNRNADLLREHLAYKAGIIYEISVNQFRFTHPSFEEYLSACYLVRIQQITDIADLIISDPVKWRFVTSRIVDELLYSRRYTDLWELLVKLIRTFLRDPNDATTYIAFMVIDLSNSYNLTNAISDLAIIDNSFLSELKKNCLKLLGIVDLTEQERKFVKAFFLKLMADVPVSELITYLYNQDNDIRAGAAFVLALLGNTDAIVPLIKMLADPFPNVRILSVAALGDIGHPSAMDALISALGDSDDDVRTAAGWGLGKIGDSGAMEALITAWYRSAEAVQVSLTWALGELGLPISLNTLSTALKSPMEGVRINATDALGKIEDDKVVPLLLQSTEDTNASVRGNVAIILGKRREPAGVEVLIHMLKDEDSEVRQSAATALGSIGDLRAFSPLIFALGDPDFVVQYHAARALGQLGDRRATEPLIVALKNKLYMTHSLIQALTELADERAIEPLIDCLASTNPNIRDVLRSALISFGEPCLLQLVKRLETTHSDMRASIARVLGEMRNSAAVDALLKLLNDEDVSVKAVATHALGQIRDARATEPLINLLKDNHVDVRNSAAQVLGKIGNPVALEPLISVLNDEDEGVRAVTVQAIGRIGTSRAIDVLQSIVFDEQNRFQSHAAHALAMTNNSSAVPILISCLTSSNTDLRIAAATSLGHLKSNESDIQLIKLLNDEDDKVKLAAIEALGDLNCQDAISLLIELLNCTDYHVQSIAINVLGKLGATQAVDRLLHLMNTTDQNLQRVIAQALGQIQDSRSVESLTGLLYEAKSEKYTVKIVYQALQNLGYAPNIKPFKIRREEN